MTRSSVADNGVCLHGVEEEEAEAEDGAAGTLCAWAPAPPTEDREEDEVGRMAAAPRGRLPRIRILVAGEWPEHAAAGWGRRVGD
jgi:hypothetical protein